MDWESLLPSLPESPCNSQDAWEDHEQGRSSISLCCRSRGSNIEAYLRPGLRDAGRVDEERNREALLLFKAGEWIGALQTNALSSIVSEHACAWDTAETQEAADRGGDTDLHVDHVNEVRL